MELYSGNYVIYSMDKNEIINELESHGYVLSDSEIAELGKTMIKLTDPAHIALYHEYMMYCMIYGIQPDTEDWHTLWGEYNERLNKLDNGENSTGSSV